MVLLVRITNFNFARPGSDLHYLDIFYRNHNFGHIMVLLVRIQISILRGLG